MQIDKELAATLEDRLALHEKMRRSYFFNPPGSASSRRGFEMQNSRGILRFEVDGCYYTWEQVTSCSCKTVRYRSSVTKDDVKRDIRAIKKVSKQVAESVVDAMRKGAQLATKK